MARVEGGGGVDWGGFVSGISSGFKAAKELAKETKVKCTRAVAKFFGFTSEKSSSTPVSRSKFPPSSQSTSTTSKKAVDGMQQSLEKLAKEIGADLGPLDQIKDKAAYVEAREKLDGKLARFNDAIASAKEMMPDADFAETSSAVSVIQSELARMDTKMGSVSSPLPKPSSPVVPSSPASYDPQATLVQARLLKETESNPSPQPDKMARSPSDSVSSMASRRSSVSSMASSRRSSVSSMASSRSVSSTDAAKPKATSANFDQEFVQFNKDLDNLNPSEYAAAREKLQGQLESLTAKYGEDKTLSVRQRISMIKARLAGLDNSFKDDLRSSFEAAFASYYTTDVKVLDKRISDIDTLLAKYPNTPAFQTERQQLADMKIGIEAHKRKVEASNIPK